MTTPTFLREVYAPGEGTPTVDIVFVHGLNPFNTPDFAEKTWTLNGILWPRDLLPQNVPDCRILIFGYNSNVAWDVSLQGIKDHANNLLDRFVGNRDVSEESRVRPIIFVAHSLGGLVIKQALINATNNSHAYGSIKAATHGLVFFGTPHQGGNGTALGKVASNIVTAVSGKTRNDLLDSLSKNSMLTQNANDDFRHQWEDYRVVSFYETKKTTVKGRIFRKILNSIVVDATSAKLGLGGRWETQLPIDADHSGMCKFEAADDRYEPIGRNIRNLVDYSIQEANNRVEGIRPRPTEGVNLQIRSQASQAPEPRSADGVNLNVPAIKLSEAEQKFLQGFFSSDYKTHRQEISCRYHSGTCKWIFKHPEYIRWSENKETCQLWISGNPGMGKSVLASFLLTHLENSVKGTVTDTKRVAYFFFDDKDQGKRTAVSLLRAIIHQLLAVSPSLLKKHAMPHYLSLGNQLYDSFATLWTIFIAIVNDIELEGAFCIIDALDECEEKSRGQLLRQFAEYSNSSEKLSEQPKRNFLKVIFTSRPYESIRTELSAFSLIRLEAEREEDNINEDIKQFISSKVEILAKNRRYNDMLRKKVENTLNEGADGMFLWVVLIIEILSKTPVSDVDQKLKELPKKIDDVYTEILGEMPHFGWKILMWVLHSYRPLKLSELAIAYTIKKEHKTLSSIPTDTLGSIRADVQLCGPILKVQNDGSVHLVHQSAKDFLLRSNLRAPFESTIRDTDPHHEISIASLTYLSLQGLGNLCHPQCTANWINKSNVKRTCERLPFLEYAAMHWHRHVIQAREKSNKLWESVNRLLREDSKRMLFTHVYDLMSDMRCNPSQTPLHILSRFGFYFFLQQILEQAGVNVDFQDGYGRTPLSWAAENGHVEVVRLLVATEGVDVDFQDGYGQTPLSWAAENGHVEVVRLLVATEGVDVDSKDTYSGQTPLSRAVSNGHVEVVRLLVATEGVDVDSKGGRGQTPLSRAAENGHVEVVRLLVATEGVDVDSKDTYYGQTPLSWAASNGHVEVVRLLVATEGVDVDSKDTYSGQTPLSRAVSNGHVEVVRLLVATEGVDVDSKNRSG